jgi:hypothetical protein
MPRKTAIAEFLGSCTDEGLERPAFAILNALQLQSVSANAKRPKIVSPQPRRGIAIAHSKRDQSQQEDE